MTLLSLYNRELQSAIRYQGNLNGSKEETCPIQNCRTTNLLLEIWMVVWRQIHLYVKMMGPKDLNLILIETNRYKFQVMSYVLDYQL